MEKQFRYIFAFLSLLGFALQSCGGNAQKASENKNEEIKAITIISSGGQMGYSSFFKITKDSIKFSSYLAVDTTQNTTSNKRINPQDWNDIIAGIDLENFKNATNGHSVQPVDGIDTEILVNTNNGEISKMNAYDNEMWNCIQEKLSEYLSH